MEIVPGLHQVKTPMPSPALPYVLPYIFECDDGVGLFDAGYGTPEAIAADAAAGALAELRLGRIQCAGLGGEIDQRQRHRLRRDEHARIDRPR